MTTPRILAWIIAVLIATPLIIVVSKWLGMDTFFIYTTCIGAALFSLLRAVARSIKAQP